MYPRQSLIDAKTRSLTRKKAVIFYDSTLTSYVQLFVNIESGKNPVQKKKTIKTLLQNSFMFCPR